MLRNVLEFAIRHAERHSLTALIMWIPHFVYYPV